MGLGEAWMISVYCLFDFLIMRFLQEFFKEPDIQLNQINSMAKAEVSGMNEEYFPAPHFPPA